ncbi:MAG TPA: PadR family transcriptional regulator [Acidimicrobiia bacterium]|jgi:DNA-binding PadR family transcriptional regulator|nr:PadR family transcriptional regulator [Acidimicrobiia bacterium]
MDHRHDSHHRGQHRRPGAARSRLWNERDGSWEVHARVERFVEPALLLVLRDDEVHGYDLAARLEALVPDERVDLGNLYRMLRGLEEDGLVASRWRDDLPGRVKRTYALTPAGRALLDAWAKALRATNDTTTAFLRRYQQET